MDTGYLPFFFFLKFEHHELLLVRIRLPLFDETVVVVKLTSHLFSLVIDYVHFIYLQINRIDPPWS